MKASNYPTQSKPEQSTFLSGWVWLSEADLARSNLSTDEAKISASAAEPPHPLKPRFDLFKPLRRWLDQIDFQESELAHLTCKLIPAQCPFERNITVFGCTILHIPPMCKFNPVYEQVVSLRFRALCYLADKCGEDVTPYC